MESLDTPLQPYSIFLRSSDYTSAIGSSKSNLFFDLNTPIKCYSNMNMLVKLISFKYTNSFYTINNTNNYFYYKFLSGSITSVQLTNGNYNIDTFLNHLSSLLSGIFTFSYSDITLKPTISSVSLQTFILYTGSNNCFEVLGFDTVVSTSYNNIQIAPYIMNLIGTEVLHVTVPNISLNSVGVKNQTKYSILDSIHVNSAKGETETYYNISDFHYKISDNLITYLNIIIYDQNFNIVDFNNIDWYINIVFSFSYINNLVLPPTLTDIQPTMRDTIIEEERRNILQELENNI
jgi:hypothetical protein